MFRTILLSLAMLSTPALAAAPAYHADPLVKPAEDRVLARGSVWRCGDDGCVTSGATSRAAVMCTLLVREVGALRSFSADGRAFAAEALQSCNERARR